MFESLEELKLENSFLRAELADAIYSSSEIYDDYEPLEAENEYLRAALAWSKAFLVPLANWFNPPLKMPPRDGLSYVQLQEISRHVIGRLAEKGVMLVDRDDYGPRELYDLLRHCILPSPERTVHPPGRMRTIDCRRPFVRFGAPESERQHAAGTSIPDESYGSSPTHAAALN